MECGRMRATTIIILGLVAILVVVCGVIMLPGSRTSAPTAQRGPDYITTAKGMIPVPGTAYMDGEDKAAGVTVQTINIWDTADRQRVVCTLSHGDSVSVVAAERNASEGRYYFHVRAGSCDGWVSEPFVGAK